MAYIPPMVSPLTSCCKNKRPPLTHGKTPESTNSGVFNGIPIHFEQLFGRYELTILDHFNEGGLGTISLLIKVGQTGDTLVTIGL
jgi:hypothetical protein